MNSKKWLKDDRLQVHPTNEDEIGNLFKLVDHDLKDAQIELLSVDRRFAVAYNAALQLATIVLHLGSYRIKSGGGHHWLTISSFPEIMGENQSQRANFLNACRAKRNVTDYDRAGEISDFDLKELLEEVKNFKKMLSSG